MRNVYVYKAFYPDNSNVYMRDVYEYKALYPGNLNVYVLGKYTWGNMSWGNHPVTDSTHHNNTTKGTIKSISEGYSCKYYGPMFFFTKSGWCFFLSSLWDKNRATNVCIQSADINTSWSCGWHQ